MVLAQPHTKVLVDSALQMIYYSPEHSCLRVRWLGQHDAESARLGCQQLLQVVYKTKSRRLLNDSSEAFGDWTEIAVWIGTIFTVQLQEAGIEAIAWVNAMDWPARNCVTRSIQHMSSPLVASFDFDQIEEAEHWLLHTPTDAEAYLSA